MTDEYYQKKRLEEMQKQTECMEEQNKLLNDIKDIGMMLVSELGFLVERNYNPLGVTKDDVDELGDYIKEVRKGMMERWSE